MTERRSGRILGVLSRHDSSRGCGQRLAIARRRDGDTTANAYGHLPLIDLDPARPNVKPEAADDYWDQVDYIVSAANQRGL